MDNIRYPIGEFIQAENPTLDQIKSWIRDIERTPGLLRSAVIDLNEEQLNIPYRPEGWTIRQIVHHIADNNMNAFFRFKRTLTEDQPLIPTFREDLWAGLVDYNVPIDISLKMTESIYQRFVVLLRSLELSDYKRTMNSVTFGVLSLETAIQRFLWHDRHHLAQIMSLRNKENW